MNKEQQPSLREIICNNEYKVAIAVFSLTLLLCLVFTYLATDRVFQDTYQPEKGDQAVVTYQVSVEGKPTSQVAVWVDPRGVTHHAKEIPTIAGFNVPLLLVFLGNLCLAKMMYDFYLFLIARLKK